MWQNLTMDSRKLNTTIQVVHQASQFVAMFGNSYLPKQADDSQNNFDWNEETNQLEGRWIEDPEIRLSLDVINFELIIDKYLALEPIPLDGWNKDQVLSNLIAELKKARIDTTKLHTINHFKIPKHPLDAGQAFGKPAKELLEEWALYLSNSQLVLEEIKSQYDRASEVRVWPHHFDMGLYIPLSWDGQKREKQSVGLGLAIADAYVDEPYFYINHWSESEIAYPESLPKARFGYWNTKDWKGLVLPASAILAHTNQEALVRIFFREGISATMKLLNCENPVVER